MPGWWQVPNPSAQDPDRIHARFMLCGITAVFGTPSADSQFHSWLSGRHTSVIPPTWLEVSQHGYGKCFTRRRHITVYKMLAGAGQNVILQSTTTSACSKRPTSLSHQPPEFRGSGPASGNFPAMRGEAPRPNVFAMRWQATSPKNIQLLVRFRHYY